MSPALPLIGGGADAIPAGVRRRRRRRRSPRGRRRARRPARSTSSAGRRCARFKELMEYVLAVIERRRLLVPLPFCARQAAGDVPAVPAEAAADARPGRAAASRQRGVGGGRARRPHARRRSASSRQPIEAIVPTYLWRFRKTGQFRSRAARVTPLPERRSRSGRARRRRCATRRTARSRGAARSRGTSSPRSSRR